MNSWTRDARACQCHARIELYIFGLRRQVVVRSASTLPHVMRAHVLPSRYTLPRGQAVITATPAAMSAQPTASPASGLNPSRAAPHPTLMSTK